MILQLIVPDHFRGRVFAAEMALLTVAIASSTYGVGVMLDNGLFTARQLTFGFGLWMLIPATGWALLQWWRGSNWDRLMQLDPDIPALEVEHPEI